MYFQREKEKEKNNGKLCTYPNLHKYIRYHERKYMQGLLEFLNQYGEKALSKRDTEYLNDNYFGYLSNKRILPIKTLLKSQKHKQKEKLSDDVEEDLLIYPPIFRD